MKQDANATDRAPVIVTRRLDEPRPRIEITPTVGEYHRLCRDLAKLRAQGEPSNTAAILAAVSHAAEGANVGGRSQKSPPKRQPRAKARR
jgi:hypothetical protein